MIYIYGLREQLKAMRPLTGYGQVSTCLAKKLSPILMAFNLRIYVKSKLPAYLNKIFSARGAPSGNLVQLTWYKNYTS
jgi:hypothetical protein